MRLNKFNSLKIRYSLIKIFVFIIVYFSLGLSCINLLLSYLKFSFPTIVQDRHLSYNVQNLDKDKNINLINVDDTNVFNNGFTRTSYHFVESQSNLVNTLSKAGVSKKDIFEIVKIIKDKNLFNLTQLKDNTEINIEWLAKYDKEIPVLITIIISPITHFVFVKKDSTWEAEVKNFDVEVKLTSFSGVIDNSLWDSCEKQGVDSALISQFADIFAWQIDFIREVRRGDKWRFVVEQKFVRGKPYEWGKILVAEYVNSGKSYIGIRYPQGEERASYYDPDGKSLKKMFLKSPVKYAKITSYFSKSRFHPILKIRRPHNGVDYAAPAGTPIMAVGAGRVVFAGYKDNESGIVVKIRHNSVYTTAYLHMQRVAKGIRVGKKVEQGDVIGYVGKTGLATAPHCHFAFYKNGIYVDPLGLQFPSADPVPKDKRDDFKRVAQNMLSLLPQWQLADIPSHTVRTL